MICGALAIYSFARRPVPGSRIFAFLMLAVFIWSAAYAVELSCLTLQAMLICIAFEYIGIVSIPPLWLMLTLTFTGHRKTVNIRNTTLFFIIPLITLLLIMTNQLHFLYYNQVDIDFSGPIPLLAIDIGPWYIVFMVYYYICMLAGAILLLSRLRNPSELYRSQAAALLIGVAVPWIINILYLVFNVKPYGHLDLTPFAFTVTGIMAAWGIFRYGLFDVIPIAHELVIQSMNEGLVVLDTQNRIVDCNLAARQFFAWKEVPTGSYIDKVWHDWPELINILQKDIGIRRDIPVEREGTAHYYEVQVSGLKTRRGRRLGRMVLLHDISARKRAQEDLKRQQDKFQILFETSRDAIFITSVDGRWLEANEAAAKLFGYVSVEELKTVPVIDMYADPEARKEYTTKIASQGYADSFPAIFRKKDGTVVSVLISGVALRDSAGAVTGYQGTIRDVTRLLQYEEALLQANDRLEAMLAESEKRINEITLLGNMAQWIQASRDLETAYEGAARYLQDMFPYDSGAISIVDHETKLVEVKSTFGKPQGQQEFDSGQCLALTSGKTVEYDGSRGQEICAHLGDFRGYYISLPLIAPGDYSWLLCIYNPQSEEPSITAGRRWLDERRPLLISAGQELVMALSNVNLRETLREQATRDPLTGLYNRRYMEEMLVRELSRSVRSKRGIGFIMGDLDHFKKFNDTYGHEVGDLLLKAVANLMRSTIRTEDIACRYGGEEFLIILPSASLNDAYQRALQIHDAVANISFEHGENLIKDVTISLGVSAFPDHGKEADRLIAAADAAMYRAKKEGRNRVCLPS